MDIVYNRCCGLDVHNKSITACAITPKGKEIETFGTMTYDLFQLVNWIKSKNCTHVAMESTGVCVGVLYIETDPSRIDDRFCRLYNGRWYCVHNGRLARNYRENETQIFINHKIWDRRRMRIVEEQRLLRNIITVGRIMGESPCQSAI